MAIMTSRTLLALVAAILVAASVAAACGADDEATPGAVSRTTPLATPGLDQAHTDHEAEIDQKNMKFIPERVSVKVGETVLIKNSETAIHTGNINGKNVTGNMKKGDATTWTATEPGEYAVTCEYHPQMKATIVVRS
ncbi:MAG: cupredoxin domain-containing protein [Dehalococcoidia bacterium]|nr:cupredoxin domain-containing protein [Dehalococcoidia bacterium]